MIRFFSKLIATILKTLDFLTPVGDLIARVWVANIFFKAGWVKLMNWSSTLNLFSHVYHVPIVPPTLAAILGTFAEIVLPILLVLGLGGRIMIMIFFIYNLIAVVSYDFLFTPEGTAGLAQHINWGLLLLLLMLHGPGKLSVDYWLRKKYGKQFNLHTHKSN